MKLTKERARKPIIESGYGAPSTGYDTVKQETTFTIICHSAWVQGKGHATSYTIHLTKLEMLQAIDEWMTRLCREEIEAQKKKASAQSPAQSGTAAGDRT